MEAAHAAGIPTTATMMFGAGETSRDRIKHLQRVRDLQDKTGGFLSFIPWSFQPANTDLGKGGASTIDYLRTLAVSRIFLDNIPNIQGSWVTQGPEVGQISLHFGANDLGSIMLEENVVRAAGISHRLTREEMERTILATGYPCAQRDTLFNILKICG
jgi:cyclic dehypoxanthinyl futalosine synthase